MVELYQIFTLRKLLEKTLEFQIDHHHLFIYLKQVYDSIDRQQAYAIAQRLRRHGHVYRMDAEAPVRKYLFS